MGKFSVCESLFTVFTEIELDYFVSYFPCAGFDYGFGGGALCARRWYFVKILEHGDQGLFRHTAGLGRDYIILTLIFGIQSAGGEAWSKPLILTYLLSKIFYCVILVLVIWAI